MIYVNQTNATNLAYVSPAGTAIITVDNTSFVPWNYKRDSVRITTLDYFGVGTVWIIDALHLPFGCSVSICFTTCFLVLTSFVRMQGMAKHLDERQRLAE